ncbi:MAG: hypothetical protein ACJ76J_08690 [Thermoanaerobaculia bacterium]
MFRSMSRTATVAVVALLLVLACVPAAQASSFGTPGPSLDTRSGWFDVAISWLSGLLFGEETSSPASTGSAFEATNTTGPISDFATPLAGSCLDPAGSPRCNL